jgi:hypothetical protein
MKFTEMKYYIKRGSKRLSGFYPNDIPSVFAFRRNDFYCFSTWSEANDFLIRVNKEVNSPENVLRYGKYAKLNTSIVKNLKIEGVLV